MKDIQQLIKKNSQEGRYESVLPKTFTDAVIDKESGKTLPDILSGFNMYFLTYLGGIQITRNQVPLSIRKKGLWITYVLFDSTMITEYYTGDAVDDVSWGLDSNWKEGLTSDIWKNYRGLTTERPTLRIDDDGYPFYDRELKKYILWDGTDWTNLDGTPLS